MGLWDWFKDLRRKKSIEEDTPIPQDTTQRRLEDILQSPFSQEQVGYRNLVKVIAAHEEWKRQEKIGAARTLHSFSEQHPILPIPAYGFIRRVINQDALVDSDGSDATLDIPFSPRTADANLEVLLDSVAVVEKHKASWVYAHLWEKWYFLGDQRNRSFVKDITDSAKALDETLPFTNKAQQFFLKVMAGFSPSGFSSYGTYAARVARSLPSSNSAVYHKAFGYAHFVCDNYPATPPELYHAIFNLPKQIPSPIDKFISHAIDALPAISQRDRPSYVRHLRDLLKHTVRLLQTEEKDAIVHFYGTGKFPSEHAVREVENRLGILQEIVRGRITADPHLLHVRRTVKLLEAGDFQIEPIIYGFVKGVNPEDRRYVSSKIRNMQDILSPLEMITFAELLYEEMRGKNLSIAERAKLDDFLAQELVANTKKREQLGKIERILEHQEEHPLSIPSHVQAELKTAFPGLALRCNIYDLSEDNGAWYNDLQQVEAYLRAKGADFGTRRALRNFYGKVATHLFQQGCITQDHLLLIGLGCGDALPELELAEILKTKFAKGGEELNIHYHLIDRNAVWFPRVAAHLHRRRIAASLSAKDMAALSYEDLHPWPPDRQLIITISGRTFYNLGQNSNKVLDAFANIALHHHNNPYGTTSPTLLLIEGDKEKNVKYYTDKGSEQMHWLYVANRLGTHKRAFAYNGGSTYRAILTPDSAAIEFYFVTTTEIDMKRSDGTQYEIPPGQVIRVGESRTIQPETVEKFSRLGEYQEIVDRSGRVMSIIIPDIKKLEQLGRFYEPRTDRHRLPSEFQR